jgi:hypothetical protein
MMAALDRTRALFDDESAPIFAALDDSSKSLAALREARAAKRVYVLVYHSGAYSDYYESVQGVYEGLDDAKVAGFDALKPDHAELSEWTRDSGEGEVYHIRAKGVWASAGCYIHACDLVAAAASRSSLGDGPKEQA